MPNLIGQRLDKYEIVALLGEGGMAAVYRARQPNMKRDVAIKVIKHSLVEKAEFIKRFEREAQTVAALSHPFVLKVFDYGEHEDLVYLVMELLTGGSLADLIRKGPLPLEDASRILDQVASALDYAHHRGVIHRDLKPQNVLLDDEGNAHLTDFGIAKLASSVTALTQSGMAMGTPAYMPPEQWKGQPVDARADIYALGVMLFEMLTGRLPFIADTPFSFMHMHVNEAPPSVHSIQTGLPSSLDRIILRALAKDPNERFASASDMAKAFKATLSVQTVVGQPERFEQPEQPESTYAPTVAEGVPTPTTAQRKRPVLLIGAGVVALALIGVILALLAGRQGVVTGATSLTETAIAALSTPAVSATTPDVPQTVAAAIASTNAAGTAIAERSATKSPTATPVPTRTSTPIPPTATLAPTSTSVPRSATPATAVAAVATSGAAGGASRIAAFARGKTIKIGWAGDMSLQVIKPSLGALDGAMIAVRRRNASGGIKGFSVEIVALDDQCTGEQAVTVARKFASDPGVVGVVGHVCSGATIPASDVYEKARIVMVSPSSTAYAVTNRGLSVVNRVAFSDDKQALADALYIYNELKLTKLAILDDNQSYGKGLADALKREFKRLGGQVLFAGSINKDVKDYRPVLTRMLSNPPEALFFGGYYGPAALLTAQMKEVGLTNAVFLSDDGTYTADYLQLAGKVAEGAYASFVTLKVDQAAMDSFKAEFEKVFNVQYGEYDPYQGHGFDAANLILNAIDQVATVDASGNLVIDREALIKAVRNTKGYKGLTGRLTCDRKGECGAGEISIFKVQGGQWALVKTYTAADLQG